MGMVVHCQVLMRLRHHIKLPTKNLLPVQGQEYLICNLNHLTNNFHRHLGKQKDILNPFQPYLIPWPGLLEYPIMNMPILASIS
jgi:hypothetical protein